MSIEAGGAEAGKAGHDLARAYLETLLQTERLPEAELRDYQAGLLEHLLDHVTANVPFYRDRADLKRARSDIAAHWAEIPTIGRSTIAEHGRSLFAPDVPQGHGALRSFRSGGSTGAPVTTRATNLEGVGRVVATYRMFGAYGIKPGLPLVMIRNAGYSAGWTDAVVHRKWAQPWLPEDELGDRFHLDFATPAREQLDWLAARAPIYVNTLPSNTLRLVLEAERRGPRPEIPAIISVAEYLAPEVAAAASRLFGSRVINILSSSEAGVIAIECPQSGMLHVQSELLLVEILDAEGRAVAPGETGELVVTPFYNYAMPLIRYRSGDFVVKGAACPCGRSLPTVERFAGRKEHVFWYPGGRRDLPPVDRVAMSLAIGHDAWQLVQTGEALAELRHEALGSDADRDAIREALRGVDALGFDIAVREVDSVPKTSGGKRHFTVNELAMRTGPDEARLA